MEIEADIKKRKELYISLMDFISASDNLDYELQLLIEIFEKQDILTNRDEIISLYQLISKISDSYHRTPTFFVKLEKLRNTPHF